MDAVKFLVSAGVIMAGVLSGVFWWRAAYAKVAAKPILGYGQGTLSEITAKVAKSRCRICEVGISYYGRTYEQGKKIGWKDGFHAIWCILKYNLLR